MELTHYSANERAKVAELFYDVFKDSEGESEGEVLKELVLEMTADREPPIGFLGKEGEKIIAAVFFTAVKLSSKRRAFILSPMAVASKHQGKGLGQLLLTQAIKELAQRKCEILITYGDPQFYGKVGFNKLSEEFIKAPFPLSFPHGWLGMSLTTEDLEQVKGDECHCCQALSNSKYW